MRGVMETGAGEEREVQGSTSGQKRRCWGWGQELMAPANVVGMGEEQ